MGLIRNSGLQTVEAILQKVKTYVDGQISSTIRSIKVRGKTVVIQEGTVDLDISAEDTSYDDSETKLDADNVQDAIEKTNSVLEESIKKVDDKVPFGFGIDSNGAYGYLKKGDTEITKFGGGGGGSAILYDTTGQATDGAMTQKATTDEFNNRVPFRLGIDSKGNYGYYKEGADTVTPFKSGESIEFHHGFVPLYFKNINPEVDDTILPQVLMGMRYCHVDDRYTFVPTIIEE